MPLLDWLSFLKSFSIKDQHCCIISSISLFESGPKDHIIDKFVKFQILTVAIFCSLQQLLANRVLIYNSEKQLQNIKTFDFAILLT